MPCGFVSWQGLITDRILLEFSFLMLKVVHRSSLVPSRTPLASSLRHGGRDEGMEAR